MENRTREQVKAAMRAVEEASSSPAEKAEMLMEIAMGLQHKPQTAADLTAAADLYRVGLDLCPGDLRLLRGRIRARLGTALMAVPSEDAGSMLAARKALEEALTDLTAEGLPEEVAEVEMNLGIVLQNLASEHKARIQDAISAYQRALRIFDRHRFPGEFAILQSNLATAFLSIPLRDATSQLREALAVQAFEEALSVVSLIDHPREYAMLQNNLGNALQYAASGHQVENGYRALQAYDEALKVRTRRAMPDAYATTIANKANCLVNLPDDPAAPAHGNAANLGTAIELYRYSAGNTRRTRRRRQG